MSTKISVSLALYEPLLEAGMRWIIQKQKNIVLNSSSRSQEEVGELLQSKNAPDILLIDVFSPRFDLDKIAAYTSFLQKTKIIPLTDERNQQDYIKLFKLGIKSYLLKICDEEEIVLGINNTFKGNKFVCAQVLKAISQTELKTNNQPYLKTCEGLNISEREIEIIKLIAEGSINKEIADKLFLSNHTINTHRKNIMQKLGVNNTAGIVVFAVKEQIISASDFLFSSKE